MDHETLVGFTEVLYNVMGCLTGGAAPRHRSSQDKSGFKRSVNVDRSCAQGVASVQVLARRR